MMKATRAAALLHSIGVMAAMAASATARFVRETRFDPFATAGARRPPSTGGYRNRAGWTNARYKRAALKRRNVLRNRRAHRG